MVPLTGDSVDTGRGRGVMEIIDAHAHLGTCNVFDLDVSFETLLEAMDANGVNTSIVQPFPGCENPRKVHDRIAQLSRKHPGRFYGVASMNPHMGDESFKEMRRCVRDLKFIGVKLHTIGHAMMPTSKDGMKVAELAAELDVPMLVHTGTGIPFALPSLCLPAARQFPNLKIILCHAGYAVFAAEAIIVAKEASNIYLEPSWCTSTQTRGMIRELGAARVIMGSDLPANLPTEIAKAKSVGLSQEELLLYLGGSARKIFNITSSK
jgi:predicted TIM-barrel fold metal-dependent hydrolase